MPWNDRTPIPPAEPPTDVTIHWKPDGNQATNPTTYKNVLQCTIAEGVLVVRYEHNKIVYVPLQNIWHINLEIKEAEVSDKL